MSMAKVASQVLLVILLLGSSSCYSYSIIQTNLPRDPERADPGMTVRVTKLDGERISFKKPWMNAGAVGGEKKVSGRPNEPVEIPLSEVDLIEEGHFEARKTLWWALVALGSLGVGITCGMGTCWMG